MAITATSDDSTTVSTLTPTFALGFTASAGDLIIAAVGVDSAVTAIAWGGSWVELNEGTGTGIRGAIGYLIASGGETTVSLTGSGSADRWEACFWRIPAGEWRSTTAPEAGGAATGSSVNPTSGSMAPSWGSEANNIFGTVAFRDDSVANTITGYPANYSTAQIDRNALTSACNVGGAVRITTAASDDAGNFTISASETWRAVAWAGRPAAAGTTITPGIFAIVWTGFAPTVTASDHKTVTPAAFAVAWTGFAPTVTASDHKLITPSPFALAWTGLAPTVSVSDHKTITPAPFTLAWTGLAPTVTAGGGTVITPNPFAVAWTGLAPTLTVTDHKLITPDPFAVAWTGLAPTVTAGGGQAITPAPFAIAWTGLAPSLAITDHKTITPDPFDLAWTGYVPLVVAGPPEPSRLDTPIGTSHGRPVTVMPYG